VGTDMYFIERGSVQLLTFRTNWRDNFADEAASPSSAARSDKGALTIARARRAPGSGSSLTKGSGSSSPKGGSGSSSSKSSGSSSSSKGSGSSSSKVAPAIAGSVEREGEPTSSVLEPQQQQQQQQSQQVRTSMPGGRRLSMRRLSNSAQTLAQMDEVNEADVILLNSLRGGQFFGETAVFFNERRACSARATDFSELFVLSREQLDQALLRFPHDADTMFAVVLDYRSKNSTRNESVRSNLQLAKVKGVVGGAVEKESRGQQPGQLAQQSTFFERTFRKAQSGKVAPAPPPPVGSLKAPTIRESLPASEETSAVLFKPNGDFHRCWNAGALLGTLYLCWCVPYRFAFLLEPEPGQGVPWSTWGWFALDWAVDLFFLVDVVLRYRYFAVNRFGYVVKDRDEIAALYRSSWMLLDCLACIPLDLYALAVALEKPEPGVSIVVLLSSCRLIKLLRGLKLPYYINFAEQHLHEMLASGLSSAVARIVKLVGLLLTLHHFFACGWFSIIRWVPTDPASWQVMPRLSAAFYESMAAHQRGFAGHHELFDRDASYDPWSCYMRALFFTVASQGAVGFGGVRPVAVVESVWQLVVLFVGSITFAGVIGSMAVLYQRWDSRGDGSISIKNRLRKVIAYMQQRELPAAVQRDIVNHLASSWEHSQGLDMESVLGELPLPLQLDLAHWVHRPVIRAVKGLRRCHVRVQRHIARRLKPQVLSKGAHVYREGEIGREIYFILAGTLRIGAAELGPGQHFGGSTLYSPSGLRTETVLCETDCELFLLRRDDFERIMIEFPEHRTVGIFAELIVKEKHTVLQARELRRQVAEISGNVKNSPLAALAARHIDAVLGGLDTSAISGVRAPPSRATKLGGPLVAAAAAALEPRQRAADDLVCGKRMTALRQLSKGWLPGENPALKPRDKQSEPLATIEPLSKLERIGSINLLTPLQEIGTQEVTKPLQQFKQAAELLKPDIKHEPGMRAIHENEEEEGAEVGDIGDVYAAFLKKTGKARNLTSERRSVTYEDAEQLLRTQRRGLRDDEPSHGAAYVPQAARRDRDRKGKSEAPG
jgi:CRP-like cAMP-binding protein